MFKFDSNGDIILVHLPGCCNNNNQCAATGCLTESDTNSDSDTVIVADSDSDSDTSVQDTLDDLKSLDAEVNSLNEFVNSPYAHMVDCSPLVNQFDSVRLRVKDIPIHGSFEEQMTLYDDKMDIIETISDIGDRIISLGHIRNLGLSVGVFD